MVALDLRHVASPAVRDLIHLLNLPDFDRAHQQIDRLGGCTEPVRLIGQTTTIDTATGEVVRSYDTADEPTGSLLTSCGNRRASRCPACSRVYAADTFQLIRAGLTGGKSVPDTVRTHPRVFATLTAPSFGPVHNRPTDTGGVLRPYQRQAPRTHGRATRHAAGPEDLRLPGRGAVQRPRRSLVGALHDLPAP